MLRLWTYAPAGATRLLPPPDPRASAFHAVRRKPPPASMPRGRLAAPHPRLLDDISKSGGNSLIRAVTKCYHFVTDLKPLDKRLNSKLHLRLTKRVTKFN